MKIGNWMAWQKWYDGTGPMKIQVMRLQVTKIGNWMACQEWYDGTGPMKIQVMRLQATKIENKIHQDDKDRQLLDVPSDLR
jgi:hypothetical protein